jgi:hypothetical protein
MSAAWADWIRSTHRYWTPEAQSRITTGEKDVDHIPPRLR